jgi:hypothetical protein
MQRLRAKVDLLIRRPLFPAAPLLVASSASLACEAWEDATLADAAVFSSGEPEIAEEATIAEAMVGVTYRNACIRCFILAFASHLSRRFLCIYLK